MRPEGKKSSLKVKGKGLEVKFEDQRSEGSENDVLGRTFNCGLCQERFENKDRLLKHLSTAHWDPRPKPDAKSVYKLRPASITGQAKTLSVKADNSKYQKTASQSKKTSKKSSPAIDLEEKNYSRHDAVLGKRRMDDSGMDDRLKVDEHFLDQISKGSAYNEKRLLASGGLTPVKVEQEMSYRLRRASQSPHTMQLPRKVKSPKSASKPRVPGQPGTGKRGRPRKNRPENSDHGPANWKWRSNVCVHLPTLDPVQCGFKGCTILVQNVSSVLPKRRDWAMHMLDHLKIPTYVCKHCEKMFFNDTALDRHVLIHDLNTKTNGRLEEPSSIYKRGEESLLLPSTSNLILSKYEIIAKKEGDSLLA